MKRTYIPPTVALLHVATDTALLAGSGDGGKDGIIIDQEGKGPEVEEQGAKQHGGLWDDEDFGE